MYCPCARAEGTSVQADEFMHCKYGLTRFLLRGLIKQHEAARSIIDALPEKGRFILSMDGTSWRLGKFKYYVLAASFMLVDMVVESKAYITLSMVISDSLAFEYMGLTNPMR